MNTNEILIPGPGIYVVTAAFSISFIILALIFKGSKSLRLLLVFLAQAFLRHSS